MGWCTHPKRRTGNEVRIYVRAHELPCRNDWANDLWQAADHTDIVLEASALPVAPATADELAFLAAIANRPKPDSAAADAAARGEDVVVGEVTASIAAGEMSHPDQSRMTLRRAHEEVKSRKREQRSVVSPLTDNAGMHEVVESAVWPALEQNGQARASTGETQVANRDATSGNGTIGEVSPVALGEMGRPFPKMTTFPEDDARFSSIPEPVEGFELPLATRREAPRMVGRAGFDDDHSTIQWNDQPKLNSTVIAGDDLPVFDEIPDVVVDPEPVVTQQPRRRFLSRPRQRPVREHVPLADDFLAGPYTEPEHAPYVEHAERVYDKPAERSVFSYDDRERATHDVFASADGFHESEPAQVRPVEPIPQVDWEPPASRGGSRRGRGGVERSNAAIRLSESHQYEAPEHVGFDADLIRDVLTEIGDDLPVEEYVISPGSVDDEIAAAEPPLWSTIPRMCRTCRDFRPAENGERGWCTNKWAFSHRRMVDADELPCETSIGGWWIPHDDSWMSAVDVTAHSQPTPLLDQWLALRAAANGEYDAASPLRRRQRS